MTFPNVRRLKIDGVPRLLYDGLTDRAGFRRGQSGQLPRGPHKKGPPQILIIPFDSLCIMIYKVYDIYNIRKFLKLARTHRYPRLFGTVGIFLNNAILLGNYR